MVKKNNITELKEKYPAFFEVYPFKLIEFALSEKTAQKITNICVENKITDQETVEKISFRITYVLFGKLPAENLALTLERGADLDSETAKKISTSAEKIIFSEIPSLLEETTPEEEKDEAVDSPPKASQKNPGKDTYREPIE